MSNKTIKDDVVKWPSKRKYPCKRNKGEHEWGLPCLKYGLDVRYLYENENGGVISTSEFFPEKKLINVYVEGLVELTCKHCGHKASLFIQEKIR